jgi:hypothetical protein
LSTVSPTEGEFRTRRNAIINPGSYAPKIYAPPRYENPGGALKLMRGREV